LQTRPQGARSATKSSPTLSSWPG